MPESSLTSWSEGSVVALWKSRKLGKSCSFFMGVFFPFKLGVKPLRLCFHLSHDDLDFKVFSENEVYHRHMHTKTLP